MYEDGKYWVVIPAAGTGTRMNADRPKQYLAIGGKTVLEYTLDCFLQRDEIEGVMVAISKQDQHWPALPVADNKKVIVTAGGKQRFHSVLNSLNALSETADERDWVLVHDAARPCLSQSAIDRLMIALRSHDVGGILALPCKDTMKRSDDNNAIETTVARERLWHAQTPQMFRYGKLLAALRKAQAENQPVTDEAMALESCGEKPKLIMGHLENIKLTHNDDLQLAAIYLKQGI